MSISTHVLDLAAGAPAAGIPVTLEFCVTPASGWVVLGRGKTGADGRIRDLLPENQAIEPGVYCIRFDTSAASPFFPSIAVQFLVADARQQYHIPLVLSPFGYSTYRGG